MAGETSFESWQQALQRKIAAAQTAQQAQKQYQGQYNTLLDQIARASTRSYTPTGQQNPATGGWTVQSNGVRNAPGVGTYLKGYAGLKGIDPGAFDFAQTYLTGANKGNLLPASDLNPAFTPELQTALTNFQQQFGGVPPSGVAYRPSGGVYASAQALPRLQAQLATGQKSWQQYQQDLAANATNQQTAYADMMGGNVYGGVIPAGVNPNIQQPWAPPQAPQGLGEGMGGGGGFSGTGQAADNPNPNRATRLAGQQPQGLQPYGQTGIDGVMVPAAAPQQPGPPGWDQGVAGGVQNNPWNWLNQSQPSWTQQQNPMTFGTSPWSFASK